MEDINPYYNSVQKPDQKKGVTSLKEARMARHDFLKQIQEQRTKLDEDKNE
jgi:hypothetical protein